MAAARYYWGTGRSDGFGTCGGGGRGNAMDTPIALEEGEGQEEGGGRAYSLVRVFPNSLARQLGARFRPAGRESQTTHWARGRRVLGRLSDEEQQAAGRQRAAVWRLVVGYGVS